MMKIKIILFLFVAAFATSCSKYLEHAPDQRTVINTPEKVGELLVTAYPRANYMMFCEAMSDNVTDNYGMSRVDPINTDAYFWRDIRSTSRDSPTAYWNDCYAAIATANHALEAIEEAGTIGEYIPRKGEALLARAYSHFMLVSLFSKSYDPATAATDLGIPYVTDPETTVVKNYERKTVKFVYEQVEKDLTEGLKLINDNVYKIPPYHFTKKAANAFAARFYLFYKKPEKVIEHANKVFADNDFIANMRPWQTKYTDITYEDLSVEYTKATEKANLLLIETQSWWGSRWRDYRYSTSASLRNEIFGANVTGGPLVYKIGQVALMSYYVRKFTYYFVRIGGSSGTTGYGYTMIPAFSTEEVLFNRAEAYTMLEDYANALIDLNTFVSTRVTGYNAANHSLNENKVKTYYGESDTKKALIKTILDLKRPEFIHEGIRWFDILRHNLPVVHKDNDGREYRLAANDLRKTLQLPPEVISESIKPNPR